MMHSGVKRPSNEINEKEKINT